ncbi:unnamed protein product [Caenorhabditis brenneri]
MLSHSLRVKVEKARKTKERVFKILRQLAGNHNLTREAVRTRYGEVSRLSGEMAVLLRELKAAGVGVEHLQHWENDDTESEAEEAEPAENTMANSEANNMQ